MGEIRQSLDWWQYSTDWPDWCWEWPSERKEALTVLKTCIPYRDTTGWEPTRDDDFRVLPMAGYRNTYDMAYASAHVDPNRREQKIGVRFTGRNLDAYRALGGTDAALLEFCGGIGAKPSRMDIAFDLLDFKIDLIKVYKDWKDGKVKTTARVVQPFTKATRDDDGNVREETTLYFGSRQSELMVRMYDKGAEQGVSLDWCRVELEIKGEKAIVVADDCRKLGVAQVGQALLRAFLSKVPYKFWKQLIEGEPVALTPVGRKATAHDVWLLNVIIPMLADDMRQEWETAESRGVTNAVEALIREHWTRRMMMIRERYAWWEDPRSKQDNSQVG